MISEILSPNMTVNNMINNGFYAKSETFGGNGRRTPYRHAAGQHWSATLAEIERVKRIYQARIKAS